MATLTVKPKQPVLKADTNKFAKLLEKIQGLKLGGSGYWKAPEGRSTIRILPAVGTMDYFFKEVGTHYIGDKNYRCLSISTDGQQECPLCQVHDLLQESDKKAAEMFYPSRGFSMNIIDRAHPENGVQVFSPGVQIFQALTTYIQDPDYGDISDAEAGFDVKLDRVGQNTSTKYQVSLARNPSVLGTPDQVAEWLAAAPDLYEQTARGLPTPEELIRQAGLESYFGLEAEAAEEEDQTKAGPEPEPWDEEEEEVVQPTRPAATRRTAPTAAPAKAPTASSALQARMQQRAALLRKAK